MNGPRERNEAAAGQAETRAMMNASSATRLAIGRGIVQQLAEVDELFCEMDVTETMITAADRDPEAETEEEDVLAREVSAEAEVLVCTQFRPLEIAKKKVFKIPGKKKTKRQPFSSSLKIKNP